MKKLIILSIFTVLCSCLPIDKRFPIWIINTSGYNIYCHVSKNYPDTLLPVSSLNVIIIKNGEKKPIDSNEPWEETFSAQFPSDTLLIYYFNADTFNKYSWEDIRAKHKIFRKNLYSKQDLRNFNWVINYP